MDNNTNNIEYKVCSFSGHRRMRNDDIPKLSRMLDGIVEKLILSGCTTFCTGGALGFDTLAALCIIKQRAKHSELNIKLNLIMPYPQQSERWSQNEVITYEFIKDHASNFNYLYPDYNENAINERNRCLVEYCDLLVCYCNTLKSGTGSTMNYAKKCGKTIINLANLEGETFDEFI